MKQCPFCNRKYQRNSKLVAHVEITHPHPMLHQNMVKFTTQERVHLLQQLEMYLPVLEYAQNMTKETVLNNAVAQYINWNGKEMISKPVSFVWACHMLLPQRYHSFQTTNNRPTVFYMTDSAAEIKIEKSDVNLSRELHRIARNHIDFCKRIQENDVLRKVLSSGEQLNSIIDDFERFLNLGIYWDGTNFCPSLLIDLIWHASMLNHDRYTQLTTQFVTQLMPHCLEENDSDEKQDKRWNIFLKQFISWNRRSPIEIQSLIDGKENGIQVLHFMYKESQEFQQKQAEERKKEHDAAQARWKKQREEERTLMENSPVEYYQRKANQTSDPGEKYHYEKIVREATTFLAANPGQKYYYCGRDYGDDGRC